MGKAQAHYVAVIDADLQHPPEQLRVFYDQAIAQDIDLVLASRYIEGGSYLGLADAGRRFYSVGLKWIAKALFPEHVPAGRAVPGRLCTSATRPAIAGPRSSPGRRAYPSITKRRSSISGTP